MGAGGSGIGPKARSEEDEDMQLGGTGVTGHQIPPVSLEQAKQSAQMMPSGPETDDQGANGVKPTHTFDLDFVCARKRRWQGRFRCHVLNVQGHIQVGLVRSRLSGGVNPAALDYTTNELLEMISHLAVALDDTPDWAKGGKLEKIRDVRVIEAIYKEVADHEARFHGAADVDARSGDGEGHGTADSMADVPADG